MRPKPDDTIMDPAAGTGGFLTVAYQYVLGHHKLDKDEQRQLRDQLVTGQELVAETALLCAKNLHLHGIGCNDASPVISGKSSLDTQPTKQYSMVLTRRLRRVGSPALRVELAQADREHGVNAHSGRLRHRLRAQPASSRPDSDCGRPD
jgi:hypothetical protein